MGKGQELLEAAREGDKKVVEKILGQISKRSGPFITSLRRGASVNVQDDNGYTPLHHACLRGHEEIVRLLLSVDASPCIVDKKGATPLHYAAWKGDDKIVNMLLSHSSQPVNVDQLTSDQETALLIAAQSGYEEVVAQLLARGADVSIQNKEEATALDLAAHFGRFEVVQQLLYAKPQLVDRYRFPTSRGQLFPHTPLHRAAKHGHEDVVAILIEAGMDPNVKTANGTALHEAAYYGRDPVVRVLLTRGADLKVPDRRGRTVMDLLADFPSKATKKVRKTIAEYKATSGFESEEDLPAFPVHHRPPRSPSDYYDDERNVPETPNITNSITNDMSSSSSSTLTENHPQSFVKKLASKLGIRTKFNSAPNISNTSGLESEVTLKPKGSRGRSSTNTILIGNSKFFKRISKKNETGDIICNDEFDTISLDRLATLERTSVVNRSNRSCPGFKISLPNISENVEFNDSNESFEEEEAIMKTTDSVEAINEHAKVNIFEPRDPIYSNVSSTNAIAESALNECYESYDIPYNSQVTADEPKPLPRKKAKPKTTNSTIYENVSVEIKPAIPKPAARININKQTVVTSAIYENFTPNSVEIPPEPHKRTICLTSKSLKNDSSPSLSRTSTLSSDSMNDETNLEDILLSQKSKSFKHKKAARTDSNTSVLSVSSDLTEASALDHVDCSDDKSMYAIMTGTLPSKKPDVPKKKVLFRHKTFSTIEVDKPAINKVPVSDNDFLKETLAGYHIRGTGHCIYEAPSVREFIDIFNRETLYNDNVEPFTKALRRESFIETALCFCKPSPPKFHKSAEDLLAMNDDNKKEYAKIDTLKLINNLELINSSFKCFCDDESCKLHAKKRESPPSLMVKFSVINKSISTPDITLATTPVTESVTIPPVVQEEPYAVVEIKDIIKNINKAEEQEISPTVDSAPSTLSHSSVGVYSVKDIAEVLSVKDVSVSSNDTSLNSTACSESMQSYSQRQSSSSELSSHLSLKSCISNTSTISDVSFQSCIEETSDDETLQSDQSDSDTIKSDTSVTKRPWVHSNSFNYGKRDTPSVLAEEDSEDGSSSESVRELDGPGVASLECGLRARVRSGSGRRRWDEAEGTSEGDALSVSSAASSSAPQHLLHHHEYSKVSPTPPKKPPRRNLSVSPTHANSPSSGYSYDLRSHARSQDDLDDIQGAKHYLKHGRSIDQYVDSNLSYAEYEEYAPRVTPIPNPRPSLSLKNRTQPVAITAMYENVIIKEQNPRRKLRRNNQYDNFEVHPRKYSTQKSSLESLLDSQSMNSPSDCDPYDNGIQVPLSPTHYEQPPTPEHPPPSAKQAENSIHERIRPLSQVSP